MSLNLAPVLKLMRHQPSLLALLVVLLMLGMTFTYVTGKQTDLEQRYMRAFDTAVAQNYAAIKHRLSEMTVMLRGVKGHFESSHYVSKKEYHRYFTSLNLGEDLSGFQGVAVARFVSSDDLSQYLESAKRHINPDYQIKPSGQRAQYAPIIYIEPDNDQNKKAIGFDLLTNPEVKPALLRARDTGDLAMTGKLNLVQDEGKYLPASVMYIPIYDTDQPLTTHLERQRAHVGWVSGPFRISDLMASLSNKLHDDIGVSISVAGPTAIASRLHSPQGKEGAHTHHLQTVKTLAIGGVEWTLDMYTLPTFEKRFDDTGYFPALVGVILSLMMGGLVWLLGSGHANAVKLAKAMTRDLKDSETTFRSMAETIPLAIYVARTDHQTSEYVNSTFVSLFGYHQEQLQTVEDWWRLAFPVEVDYVQATAAWQKTRRRE